MTTATRFTSLSVETAGPAARPLLAASAQQFGFLPSPVAKAAHSPGMLKYLLAGFGAFDQTTLSALEREVIALTVAFENRCEYCVALHSALLSREPSNAELVATLRAGRDLTEPRLKALQDFTRAVLRERGRVPEAVWQSMRDAGFDDRHALDAMLGVAVYWFSTVSNQVTGAELDAPFEPFRWQAQ